MIGYLIYPATTPRTNNAFSWFCDAAMQNGIELKVFFYNSPQVEEQFKQAPLPDFVFLRGYHIPLAQWYESQGIKVINTSESMILCRDKFLTFQKLDELGIPTPQTLAPFLPSPKENHEPSFEECAAKLSTPFILKQLFGSKGENVYLIDSPESYRQALEQCHAEHLRRIGESNLNSEFGTTEEEIERGSMVIAQQYISFSRGRDIRVWICEGKVIGHILRYNENSFKSNFAQGGSFKETELPENGADRAIAAAQALGLSFAGVDLLYLENGDFSVCEVNGNPGFRTAKTDIPQGIFRNLKI